MVQLSAVRKVASLVSSKWLREKLSSSVAKVQVLETSFAKNAQEEFESGHIPSAQLYNMSRCVTPTPYIARGLPDPKCLQDHMQELGLNKNNHIVVYDKGSMLWSARAWWAFRVFHHYNVSVLDGGWKKWTLDKFEEENGPAKSVERGNFKIRVKLNTHLLKTFEDMVAIRKNPHISQVVDARKESDYLGQGEEPSNATINAMTSQGQPVPSFMHKGHIPYALSLNENQVINSETNCLHDNEHLKNVFNNANINLNMPMTTMCYNGFAACLLALAATKLDRKDVAVYPGSWTEYGQRASVEDVSLQPLSASASPNQATPPRGRYY